MVGENEWSERKRIFAEIYRTTITIENFEFIFICATNSVKIT